VREKPLVTLHEVNHEPALWELLEASSIAKLCPGGTLNDRARENFAVIRGCTAELLQQLWPRLPFLERLLRTGIAAKASCEP
jgi:hypothetical protein